MDDAAVAVGNLLKQGHIRKTWYTRKFVLSGCFLQYYDEKQRKKGEFELASECTTEIITPEECGNPKALHAFCLISPKKTLVLNASSEAIRNSWMAVIEQQIMMSQPGVYRHLLPSEKVFKESQVQYFKMFGLSHAVVSLTLTDWPRILVVDPMTSEKKAEISWNTDLPKVKRVSM